MVRADRFQVRVPGRACHETSPSIRFPRCEWWPAPYVRHELPKASVLTGAPTQATPPSCAEARSHAAAPLEQKLSPSEAAGQEYEPEEDRQFASLAKS